MQTAAFSDAAAALAFATAGNATMTLASDKGGRFTYKLQSSKDGKATFVKVLTGSDNENDFTYAGMLKGSKVIQTKASRIGADAPSIKALEWSLAHLSRGAIPQNLKVYHEGRCGHCARKLTTPESLESGFGPVCRGRA